MAVETPEQRDKRIERATAIVGDLPDPNTIAAERAKWDENGQLIDEAEIAIRQRERDVLLGRTAPTREDYVDPAFADAVRGPNDELYQRQQEAIEREKEALDSDQETVITQPATPMGSTLNINSPESGEPVTLASLVREPPVIPSNIGDDPDPSGVQ